MPSLIKSTYEACECSYTCGLPLRKCLRLLSVIGMISSIVYIGVGSYIIVHIVQTEKVEWFPNSYYSLDGSGPTASRIVVPPPPPPSNTVEDFGVQYQPQTPFQQNAIFPLLGEEDNEATSTLKGERGKERAIYYRRNVGLFICLAASLILINLIQLLTDVCVFHSTLKGKRSTSFWVFFLLDIILWIMTLICFITIFSGGGIFLLLVFLSGTTIRVYIVYVLHELMSDIRKPRAWSSTTGTGSEVRPEPRNMADPENGSNGGGEEDGDNDEEADIAGEEDEMPEENDGDASTSSTKTLQPVQVEDENEDDTVVVEAQDEEEKTDAQLETENGGEEEEEAESPPAEEPEEENGDEGEADAPPAMDDTIQEEAAEEIVAGDLADEERELETLVEEPEVEATNDDVVEAQEPEEEETRQENENGDGNGGTKEDGESENEPNQISKEESLQEESVEMPPGEENSEETEEPKENLEDGEGVGVDGSEITEEMEGNTAVPSSNPKKESTKTRKKSKRKRKNF